MSSLYVPPPPYPPAKDAQLNLPAHIEEHLSKLAKRGKRMHPRVRRIVEFCRKESGTSRPDADTFSALQEGLRASTRGHWREVILSAWAIGQADLTKSQRIEAIKDLSTVLDYGGLSKGEQWLAFTVLSVGGGSLWGVGSLVLLRFVIQVMIPAACRGTKTCDLLPFVLLLPAAIPLFLTPVVMGTVQKHLYECNLRMRHEAASSLGSLKRPEGVPALLRASQDAKFREGVGIWALRQTLPTLTFSEHYGALESYVVPNLCRLLRRPYQVHEEAQLNHLRVLLGALAEVGDRRAIETLEELAQRVGAQRATPQDIVQKTEAVLQILRERVARETEQATLLRGSEAPVVPETLLRSYEEKVDEPQEQLLRPTQKD